MEESREVPHRAPDRPSCQGCRFWQRLEANPTQGECRRYAPRPDASASVHMMAAWPVTNSDDWCGELAARSSSGTSNESR